MLTSTEALATISSYSSTLTKNTLILCPFKDKTYSLLRWGYLTTLVRTESNIQLSCNLNPSYGYMNAYELQKLLAKFKKSLPIIATSDCNFTKFNELLNLELYSINYASGYFTFYNTNYK